MQSPIKWVGGKRNEIKHFEKYIPKYNTYVEPFVGGGALFWHLDNGNKKIIINDINAELMNFYIQLRDNYDLLINNLQNYENTVEFYKDVVKKLNNKSYKNNLERAEIFYYTNKTTFGGKWRVNKKGEFNSSFGYYKKDHFKEIPKQTSDKLKNITILNQDYKPLLEQFKNDSNAFIFLDPPYENCDSFYVEDSVFADIYQTIHSYMNSKSKIMLVVKGDSYIEELFSDYIKERYSKNYRYNAKSTDEVSHLVITNY